MNPTRKTTHRIQAAGQSAIDIADRMFVAITNAHAAATDPKSLSDRPIAEDAGIRSKGGHSDPTADMAIAGIGIHERVFELMLANIATLELAVSNLTQFCERWAPNEGVRVKCHGGKVVDDWSNPTCDNWAELTAAGNTRGDGLCSRCRKAKERWERSKVAA